MDNLNYMGNDPGAVTFGNFINYYSFHSPNQRMECFPLHLWKKSANVDFLCLDIGCNSGDLTEEVFKSVSQNLTLQESTSVPHLENECYFLGVDIDPILIERAQEKNKYPHNVSYECASIMDSQTDLILHKFLNEHRKHQFDVTFCFSVSMWIHLNYGDEGLKKFFRNICEISKMVVVEPQPWKCYKSAVRRLKRQQVSFPFYEKLVWREAVDKDIECFLSQTCSMVKTYETPDSTWGRRIVFFQSEGI